MPYRPLMSDDLCYLIVRAIDEYLSDPENLTGRDTLTNFKDNIETAMDRSALKERFENWKQTQGLAEHRRTEAAASLQSAISEPTVKPDQ